MPLFTVHTKIVATERHMFTYLADTPEKAAKMADAERESGDTPNTFRKVDSETIIEQFVVEDESGKHTTTVPAKSAYANEAIAAILATLNEAVAVDRDAVTNLMESRVVCNDQLAAHPTIQVTSGIPDAHDPIPCMVGPLGLMCGFVERMKPGFRLVASYDDTGRVTGFAIREWAKRQPKEKG